MEAATECAAFSATKLSHKFPKQSDIIKLEVSHQTHTIDRIWHIGPLSQKAVFWMDHTDTVFTLFITLNPAFGLLAVISALYKRQVKLPYNQFF